MHVVEVDKRFIAGIFLDSQVRDEYVDRISGSVRSSLVFHDLTPDISTFPVFALEEATRNRERFFWFYRSENERREALGVLMGSRKHYYLTTFDFRKDFVPSIPGVDEMGMLNHEHFTSERR